MTGLLEAELPTPGSRRGALVLANLVPAGLSHWPDCLVLLGSAGPQERKLVFPEELRVSDVRVDPPRLVGLGDLRGSWNADESTLEISYRPELGAREPLTGMSTVALATSEGWVHVRVLVTP